MSVSSDPHGTPTRAFVEEKRSLGELLGDVTRNFSTLMRQEVDLAKAEAKQASVKAGKGIGLLAGAGVAGLLLLIFISIAAWWGLGDHLNRAWAGVIVAVVWAVVALALALAGKKELTKIKGLPQTADSVGKIPNALKGNEENNA